MTNPDPRAQAFWTAYYVGRKTQKQIASEAGCSESTVGSLIRQHNAAHPAALADLHARRVQKLKRQRAQRQRAEAARDSETWQRLEQEHIEQREQPRRKQQ